MHFFYLDESGDTGRDLSNPQQPIMVLGGINLRDKGWNETSIEFKRLLNEFFSDSIPDRFELHARELLSPEGEGPFENFSMEDRTQLAEDILDLIDARGHGIQLIAIDKAKVASTPCGLSLAFNPSRPYLCAFDYLITYINWYVKERLGISARGMIILDEKEQFVQDIERITHDRRFQGPVAHRIKWIAEISYPVDSRRNPMIQISDLVVYCTRRFYEIENGFRDSLPDDAKYFYARCYSKIHDRIARKSLIERGGRNYRRLNTYLSDIRSEPRAQWRRRYGL